MKKSNDRSSRRGVLRGLGGGALATAAGARPAAAQPAAPGSAPRPPNILLIVTDQERRFAPGELPAGFRLPAHERLLRRGVSFENHYINSCVCTPSRSVLYTGRHIQQTRMFDNTNFPWITSLSTELPTIGDLMREAGYYTAYKGKWHLTKEFETVNHFPAPTKIFTKEMEEYGFSDYLGVGDIIGHTLGGYLHDGITAAMTVNWLRGTGRSLAAGGKPWLLAVNIVNPHDVMFYDTDLPGETVQGARIVAPIAREPATPLYARQWEFALPRSHREALDAPGRPRAHADFIRAHDAMVGRIAPDEEPRWRRRHNYYLNCLRDSDRHIATVLDELDALGLASDTIVVLTADHGDLDGAHQLHAKGATAYREQNNVPLIVADPRRPGGRRCAAVTSHLDLAPTLLGLAGLPPERRAAIARDLPGKDFSRLLESPEAAQADAVRDGSLFCYNMLAYLDGDYLQRVAALFLDAGKDGLKERAAAAGLRPDLAKRGAIRAVYDGRYQFTRYFSPRQHNRPESIEALFRVNDVELFDLRTDPHQMRNLALDRRRHGELLLAMNAKLNRLIDAEVGEDVGQMMPRGIGGGWTMTRDNIDW